MAGVQAVPGVPQAQVQVELEAEKLGHLPPSKARRIVACLKRSEQMWSELSRGLGPESEQYLPVLKSRVLDDLQHQPCKQKLALYQEIFGMSTKELRTVAEVFSPNRFIPRAHRHGLNGGKAFDIVLGQDLLQPEAQEAVISYITHHRPGLCVVSPPCGPFSQLNNLSKHIREQDMSAMKRYLKKTKEGKKLLNFAMSICQMCYNMGSVFLFEHPWAAHSWREDCVRRLLRQPGIHRVRSDQCMYGLKDVRQQPLRKATGFMTNSLSLALKLQQTCPGEHEHSWILGTLDGKLKSQQAQHYPLKLVDAILSEYSRSMQVDVHTLDVVSSSDIVKIDADHYHAYFSEIELAEIHHNLCQQSTLDSDVPSEVWHQHDDPDPLPEVDPFSAGVDPEHVEQEGIHDLSDFRAVVVKKHCNCIPLPPDDHAAGEFYWRSSWSLRGATWRLLEDEVRWKELHQPSPQVEASDLVVALYSRNLGDHQFRRMRHFPGLQKVNLERLVRRAHEGLGHPETERFVRILRHGKAPQAAIDIAKSLQCSVCQTYKLPDPARRGAPPRETTAVNDMIGLDTVHLRDHQNNAVPALNIVDWGSHFQLVIPLRQETSEAVREAYRQWTKFFGPPRKILNDLGTEFRAQFTAQAERDGSEVVPGPLEAPTQRGLTERAGGIFKDLLYKAMATYPCSNLAEWKELVDITCMTRNRLLLRAGYSPIQRVMGYTPRLPGGLLSGGENDIAAADLQRIGDLDASRAMRMRKAAACAFHEADCDQALRAAALAGRRKFQNFEVGQLVYYWRRGAGTTKNPRQSYWTGPGRVLLTNLPSTVWIAHGNTIIKAAPERVRMASEEESLSISGWLDGITQAREAFEKIPRRNFVDCSQDDDPIDDDEMKDYEPSDNEGLEPDPPGDPPGRRVRRKMTNYARPLEPPPDLSDDRPSDALLPEEPPGLPAASSEPVVVQSGTEPAPEVEALAPDRKREAEIPEAAPPEKRSRLELLEVYNLQMQALAKQRARKEARASDFVGADASRLQRAISKEIRNNLLTGAYELLSPQASDQVLKHKSDKVMNSRYVLTKKPLEPFEVDGARAEDILLEDDGLGPKKAKCRHVMQGFSDPSALDVESTTPQVQRDSVVFVAQVLASMSWIPGFLDFTQAFHSGDKIARELYCRQPPEGIPGAHRNQVLRLLKTCYGLTDGPYAWFQHLTRRLTQDFGYQVSQFDPCVFYLKETTAKEFKQLKGIIGLATDDMIHGGDDDHWAIIEKIATEYKLGKNQKGQGRFTGKDIKLELDGSISIRQAFYVKDKVIINQIARKRKQQRYSKCTAAEIEQLRSQLGVLSWLSKETRCDLAGRVALLQQAFPEPRVADLIEGNKIAAEAIKNADLGIRVMPIPWDQLRVSVVTDASWGNSKDKLWLEDSSDDYWEETETEWIRHHVSPRRTTFHPGASPQGPDLHLLLPERRTEIYNDHGKILHTETVKDQWCDQKGIRVLREEVWFGRTVFLKAASSQEGVPASKVHGSLVQLQNLCSQAGQIVIYHDAKLAHSEEPSMTTVASWRSYRLKRKTVDTLAAEGQALQSGLGAVHWHRLLFLEAFHGVLSAADWRRETSKLPFFAAVDSKSLYDALSKCASTVAYASDKRTAIDLSIIKSDLADTCGKIRWIDTRSMISDPLTKSHPGDYLRHVIRTGLWAVVEEGHALHKKALERERRSESFFLVLRE